MRNPMGLHEKMGIAGKILTNGKLFCDRPALSVDGETWTYGELVHAAQQLATLLPKYEKGLPQPVTAIMAHRASSAYVGVLACLISGNTYVPLNTTQPARRILEVLLRSGAGSLIKSNLSSEILKQVFIEAPQLHNSIQLIDCSNAKVTDGARSNGTNDYHEADDGDTAYILFTSGSTGKPKGVPISHGNLRGYLNAVAQIMDVSPTDRFSQTFELTFDLSVHDMLVCWTNGAHLIVASRNCLKSPADYIIENRITCWFSVPSLAYQIGLSNRLDDGAFPDLRWSLFCGEALPVEIAQLWRRAAPNSRVQNWYGPTEATIACSFFEIMPHVGTIDEKGTLVPIGKPFDGMQMTVCDESFSFTPDGIPGELLLHGRQLSTGYLNDPEKTATSFISLKGHDGIFYRTGDRVYRAADGNIVFLGRVDNQVKIRGFRVELGEVETVIRNACPHTVNVVAMAWPPGSASGNTLVVAFESDEFDTQPVLAAAQKVLPDYMMPSAIVFLPSFPKNPSGKADRNAIAQEVQLHFRNQENQQLVLELGKQQQLLIKKILSVSPQLMVKKILTADNLFAAGMDSLSFVQFSLAIEQDYGLRLSQELVNEMAEMSFQKLISYLFPKKDSLNVSEHSRPAENSPLQRRANRAMQFIERFPTFLDEQVDPLVLAIGSSGMFRGFSPPVFDRFAHQRGMKWRSVNIGLPAINAHGITQICHFIKQHCDTRGIRCPLIIYELDPMHISVLPPAGDIKLQDKHFNGKVASFIDDLMDPEFSWQVSLYGAGQLKDGGERPKTAPNWQQMRKGEVARTFLGQVDFRDEPIAAWLAGADILKSISDCVVAFVHPVDNVMLAAAGRSKDDKLSNILGFIREKSGLAFLNWHDFVLDESDFLDFNHVNSWKGMQNLTMQIAEKIFLDRLD